MKRTIKLIIILLAAVNLSFSQNSTPTIKTTQVANNLYEFFIYADPSTSVNTYAFIGQSGVLLIDTGLPNTPGLVNDELRKITDKKITYIINTHDNGDHTGGNELLGTDACIVAHEMTRQRLSQMGFPAEGLPDITFQDSLTIWFNDEKIVLKYLPGHTDTDIIVQFKKAKIAFLGDLVFSDSFPLVQPEGDIDWLQNSLKSLSEMFSSDTRVMVSHGRELKPEELKTYLDMVIKTRELVSKAIHDSKSPDKSKTDEILKGWEQWNSTVFPGYMNENSWIDNLYAALPEGRALSANTILKKEYEQSGLKAMLAKYKSLSTPENSKYFFIERDMNNWGYALIADNKFADAIEVLKINTEKFPGSANTFDSLAEAYMLSGNKDLAIKNYEKSLELNPQNSNAVEQLKKLKMK